MPLHKGIKYVFRNFTAIETNKKVYDKNILNKTEYNKITKLLDQGSVLMNGHKLLMDLFESFLEFLNSTNRIRDHFL